MLNTFSLQMHMCLIYIHHKNMHWVAIIIYAIRNKFAMSVKEIEALPKIYNARNKHSVEINTSVWLKNSPHYFNPHGYKTEQDVVVTN